MKDPAVIDESMSTPTDGADEAPVVGTPDDDVPRSDAGSEPDDAAQTVVEAAGEAVVIAEAADDLAEATQGDAVAEADALEAEGDHDAATAAAAEGYADAEAIEAAGEVASEAVLADAVAEASVPTDTDTPDTDEASAATDTDEASAPEEAPAVTDSTPTPPAEAPAPAAAEPVAEELPLADDPFGGPGEWYVVHTYAGYENKVKTNLESRIHTMQMEDKIFRVHIPMEDVMEIKSGKKQVVQKKVFPGYLLVKMWYDNDSWYVVRNTPGVTGFVSAGTGSKPTPLSKREIEKILVVKKEEVKPQFRLGFEEGDVVRIISGPFADFNGTINEINVDQSKLKVLVNIFDRETPVELSFDEVAKA